ncbi:MAG: hypothetical protein QOF05_475 [Sphingomonadales bacterium]|jgi:hypothetical protein|nr:hypothetical protein [Sphingomonadales bacterium]
MIEHAARAQVLSKVPAVTLGFWIIKIRADPGPAATGGQTSGAKRKDCMMAVSKLRRFWIGAVAAMAASTAFAGPPYQTDDPTIEPTGHWQFRPFVTGDELDHSWSGQAGVDVNYGIAPDLQFTGTVPVDFARAEGSGWRSGIGGVSLGFKYRLLNDPGNAFQATIHPQVTLPTSTNGMESKHARILLPLLMQKDFGKTSVFGGGGYEINPGSGNRDFWVAGLVVTHAFTNSTTAGIEAFHQTPSTVGGFSKTAIDLGLSQKVGGPYSLLLGAGPTFSGGQTGYHSYLALQIDL